MTLSHAALVGLLYATFAELVEWLAAAEARRRAKVPGGLPAA